MDWFKYIPKINLSKKDQVFNIEDYKKAQKSLFELHNKLDAQLGDKLTEHGREEFISYEDLITNASPRGFIINNSIRAIQLTPPPLPKFGSFHSHESTTGSHYHDFSETLICWHGKIQIKIRIREDYDYETHILHAGESLTIEKGTVHKVEALMDSFVVTTILKN